MLGQINMYGNDRIETAIKRLKTFEPPEGYYLAFSGGKDSIVIKALADMANVKYDAHYSVTSVDPPELVNFIKCEHKDVKLEIPRDKDGKQVTMWNLIPKKKMPPTRLVRYCCKELKEEQSNGRMTVTGVRWAESNNRRKNQGEVTVYNGVGIDEMKESTDFTETQRGGVVLNNDNAESRKLVESCYKLNKTVVNPIIDWSDDDVWEFIHKYNIPYCHLYDEGYKRLGCIGCLMSTRAADELDKYPKYKQAYLRAFDRMLKAYDDTAKTWKNADDVMTWWLGR